MPELFDVIAGSETGAIIASALVIPNQNPDDVMNKKTEKDILLSDS